MPTNGVFTAQLVERRGKLWVKDLYQRTTKPNKTESTSLKRTIGILAVMFLAIASHNAAAGDPAEGKKKAVVCIACHGPDGNSVSPIWPKLAGQHAAYLEKTLKDFRRGTRKDPTMNAMSKPLSDADIKNLAAYFASQKQK